MGEAEPLQTDKLRKRLSDCMGRRGLKASRQRDLIVDVFFTAGGHLSVEELLERVREEDSKVSQATVYRAVNLLKECGVVEARNFFGGPTLYELADLGDEHHDHLICVQCGKIIEFVDQRIEEAQERVAGEYGFTLADHKMQLYGRPNLDEAGQCVSCGKTGEEIPLEPEFAP